MMTPPRSSRPSAVERIPNSRTSSAIYEAPAAINEIPKELLSRIFELCIDPEECNQFFEIGDDEDIPIILTVCKHWRSVALGTPRLWNKVDAPPLTCLGKSPAICRFISTWLSRSRGLPLHLAHKWPGGLVGLANPGSLGYEEAVIHAARVLDIYVAYEHRWQTLDIVFDRTLLEEFHAHLQKSLEIKKSGGPVLGASLRMLRITLESSVKDVPEKLADLFKWVSSLPELKAIEHKEYGEESRTLEDLDIIPFEKFEIVKYQRHIVTFEDCLEVARRCILATDLVLDIEIGGETWHSDGSLTAVTNEKYTLPNLTSLCLERVERPLDVLKCLVLPNLEHLTISYGITKFPDGSKILGDFLEQRKRPLKTLEMLDNPDEPEDILEIYMLPAMRHVEALSFHTMARGKMILVYLRRLVGAVLSYFKQSDLGRSQPNRVVVHDINVWAIYNILETKGQGEFHESIWLSRKKPRWGIKLLSFEHGEVQYSNEFVEVFQQTGVEYVSGRGSEC